MENITTASLLIVTGIAIYAVMNHVFTAFSRDFTRLHLLFAIVCVFLVGFEISHILTYKAATLADYIPRLKWEITFIILLFVSLMWFIGEYSGLRPRWLFGGVSALAVVSLIVNFSKQYSMQYSELIRLEHVRLPWGEIITQPVGTNSPGYFIGVMTVLVVFGFGVYAFVVRYRRDHLGTSLVMLVAMIVFMLSAIEGMLVRMSVIHFIHLGPFGILAMIVAMSLALSRELRQSLHHSEYRFRSLVEQSPFSMQIFSRSGRPLQVNAAWEKLWGVSLEHIVNYNLLQDQQLRDKGVMQYIEQGFAGQPTEVPAINYNPEENIEHKGPHNDRWVRAYIYPIKDENDKVQEVVLLHEDVTQRKRFDDALRLIAAGVSSETGESFFQELVKSLSEIFGTRYAFIGVLDHEDREKINTLAVYEAGKPVANLSYELADTPCAEVIGQQTRVYPENVQSLFPDDPLLVSMNGEAYLGTPLFDSKGNPLGIIVLLHDKPMPEADQLRAIMEIFAVRAATEIERIQADELLRQHHALLQEMVEQRTAELTTVIDELEAFSYSVSHDLRAPLRSIDGFSLVLMEDYNKVLDAEGKDYLSRIRVNAQRMAQLIDDLLQLSRVTRKDINRQTVNVTDLVRESLNKYHEQNPARNVEMRVAENVIANGDPDLLAVAIDNLISNAWKYTSKKEHACIEFGTNEQDGKLSCFIRDNGAGFDMKYADKIFAPFQRLHKADEFEGTGIGLATVARIIHRHGGKVWTHAQRGQGTVMYFTLPGLHSS